MLWFDCWLLWFQLLNIWKNVQYAILHYDLLQADYILKIAQKIDILPHNSSFCSLSGWDSTRKIHFREKSQMEHWREMRNKWSCWGRWRPGKLCFPSPSHLKQIVKIANKFCINPYTQTYKLLQGSFGIVVIKHSTNFNDCCIITSLSLLYHYSKWFVITNVCILWVLIKMIAY